ncbi:hypothetical protein GALL_57900 [mine drainage metagenome]|uniref:Uncharacterized protein n=1 Tax=mine drainage metagenome TaxID=410659 RepID=A0A1J5SXP1_9ZZZZ
MSYGFLIRQYFTIFNRMIYVDYKSTNHPTGLQILPNKKIISTLIFIIVIFKQSITYICCINYHLWLT